jgi:hypothetical protein
MDNNYLLYNNVNIEDSLTPKNIYSNDKSNCLNICSSEDNCQGLNIKNPVCENNNTLTECTNQKLGGGIININPINLTQYNCKFLSNINNTNYVIDSENNTTYVKKEHADNINNLDLTKQYYLKINNVYFGTKKKQNQIFLIPVNDIQSASIFTFNKNNNIIETNTGKCLQINGDYLIFDDCIQDNLNQQFIYESKTNTFRPVTNTFTNNLCLSLNGENSLVLEECNYINKNNQEVYIEAKTFSKSGIKENFEYDNFESNNFGNLKKINFCSNTIYKTIVTLILCGILIYFIWYLTRKQYKDNNETDVQTSSIIN